MIAKRKPQLPALSGIRMVAAIAIVLYHFAPPVLPRHPSWIYNLVSHGSQFVTLFFILSGFILAYNYLEPRAYRPLDRREFWVARAARILPLYYLALFLSFLAYVKLHPPGTIPSFPVKEILIAVGTTMTLTQAWLPMSVYALTPYFPNIPAWAISVEVFFYLLFPFIGIYLIRLRDNQLLPAAAIIYLLHVLITGAFSFFGITNTVPARALWYLPEFLIGIFLGRLFTSQITKGGAYVITPSARAAWFSSLAFIGIVMFLAIEPGLTRVFGVSEGTLRQEAVLPLFALLTYYLAFGAGPIARLVSRRQFLWFAEASYAVYIFQSPLAQWVDRLGYHSGAVRPSSPAFLIAFLILLFVFSLVVLHFVELPARGAIRRAFSKPRTAVALLEAKQNRNSI